MRYPDDVVKALEGVVGRGNVHPVVVRSQHRPAVIYRQVGGDTVDTFSGDAPVRSIQVMVRVRADGADSKAYSTLLDLEAKARKAVKPIQYAAPEQPIDDYDPDTKDYVRHFIVMVKQ